MIEVEVEVETAWLLRLLRVMTMTRRMGAWMMTPRRPVRGPAREVSWWSWTAAMGAEKTTTRPRGVQLMDRAAS